MLIDCPECEKRVSDRAAACPACGFPVEDHLAEQRAAIELAKERKSRQPAGEADCPHCDARGFKTQKETEPDGQEIDTFGWCGPCEHTGRVRMVESSRGFYAIPPEHIDAFVAGEEGAEHKAVFLGNDRPEHRYPNNPMRFKD